jgi:two-component system, NtrC family, sensor kinase
MVVERQKNPKAELEAENNSLRNALTQVLYQNEMLLGWVNGGVITVDRQGSVLTANDIALEALGWSLENLKGKHYHDTFHHTLEDGGEYPWDFCPVFAAIEDGSSHHVTGDLFWRSNGESFVADYIVSPIRDGSHDIIGATLIFRNLTEQRMQEGKRIQSMKLESIGELSAGIAHEINTPIQFIGSNLSFLRECLDDLLELVERYQELKKVVHATDKTKVLLDHITEKEDEADLEYLLEEAPKAFDQTNHGVERVTELVLGLKGFAHSAESDSKNFADLNEIINNTLVVCHNSYKYVAKLEKHLGELPAIPVYHGDIGQVILNLVVNAAHAIEDKRTDSTEMGVVNISSYVEGKYIVITIADTGGGIKESVQERIFDPFFTTKDVGRGSGQGLAISRTIVREKHGGELFFDTTLGEGTTFTLKLPIEPP